MLRIKFLILFSVALQFVSGQDRERRLDSALQKLYAENKIHGNILVAEKGEVIYSKSFGVANRTTGEPLNENSIFELASVSKQFTAMGIMLLQQKGKLKIDDDFTKYIPELSFYKGITIRNLLNHTGGLPDYMELMDSLFDKSKIATNADVIKSLSNAKPAILFSPAKKFQYSNTGYVLLASIIEKVSKQTFASFLANNIFKPLGMTNTFVYSRRYQPKEIKNYAFGYIYADSSKKYILPDSFPPTKMVVWLDGVQGDGTVNSTVRDLLKWDKALFSDKLLGENNRRLVFQPATLEDGKISKYGFGVFVDSTKEYGSLVNHSGGWPGYKIFLERSIDNDKTIIILQNREDVVLPLKTIRSVIYNKQQEAF